MLGVMLSVNEVAALIGRQPGTVRSWIRAGKIKAVSHAGQYFVSELEVCRVKTLPRPDVKTTEQLKSTDRRARMAEILREASVTEGDVARGIIEERKLEDARTNNCP